jgi:hypothetical protein
MTQYPTLYSRGSDDEDELESPVDTNIEKEESKEDRKTAVTSSGSSPSSS